MIYLFLCMHLHLIKMQVGDFPPLDSTIAVVSDSWRGKKIKKPRDTVKTTSQQGVKSVHTEDELYPGTIAAGSFFFFFNPNLLETSVDKKGSVSGEQSSMSTVAFTAHHHFPTVHYLSILVPLPKIIHLCHLVCTHSIIRFHYTNIANVLFFLTSTSTFLGEPKHNTLLLKLLVTI